MFVMNLKCLFRGFLTFFFLLFLSSCSNGEEATFQEIQEKTDFALNTVTTIKLYEAPSFAEEDWEKSFGVLRELEDRMSSHKEGTEVMQINLSAGLKPVRVSDDTFEVIRVAKEIAEETDGNFDPSVGAITKLWKIGSDDQHVPQKNEIEEALKKVDYRKIILDEKEKTVFLEEEGMWIDLGAIAKGFASDKVSSHLSDRGVKRAILNFGGNIALLGSKEDGVAWKIAIRKPDRNRFAIYASLFAQNESVVSSGDYERFFEQGGKIYHHIINPFTGYPTENGIRGASVILESSMRADAYATALMVMGKERAIEFIEKKGLEAMLIFEDMSSYQSFNKDRNLELGLE